MLVLLSLPLVTEGELVLLRTQDLEVLFNALVDVVVAIDCTYEFAHALKLSLICFLLKHLVRGIEFLLAIILNGFRSLEVASIAMAFVLFRD